MIFPVLDAVQLTGAVTLPAAAAAALPAAAAAEALSAAAACEILLAAAAAVAAVILLAVVAAETLPSDGQVPAAVLEVVAPALAVPKPVAG